MALSRRSTNRFQASIWPGFVDAMTGLLLVLMFVLTIFVVIQFTLSETIHGQQNKLDDLTVQVVDLANALGLEQSRTAELEGQIGLLVTQRDAVQAQLEAADNRITGFEAQVAGLLAERADLTDKISGMQAEQDRMMTEAEALNLALAQARDEVDAATEAARLAAARREAIEALTASLQADKDAAEARLSDLEAERLVDAAAAEELRQKLQDADAELTAMTLALEAKRQDAEDTLTLIAAAEAAQQELDAARAEAAASLSEADRQAALLAIANQKLAEEQALSAESQRQVAALNANVLELRSQIGRLQGLLNLADEKDAQSEVQISNLSSQLNQALARAASENARALALEEAERRRLEEEAARLSAEAKDLATYRSEFFGELRRVLAGQEGIRIEGDRFVFSSEVLFPAGSAELSDQGRDEITKVAQILRQVAGDIPATIDWIIRVDGHTDNRPLSGEGQFANNWELSQARALSVVLYMIQNEGMDPTRLSANGFGEFQPVNPANTPEAWAQNRRIELKLTER